MEVKRRRKFLVLMQNITSLGKCWPRELPWAQLGLTTWGMSQPRAVVWWRSWNPPVHRSHARAAGVFRKQHPGKGRSKVQFKNCWERVRAALAWAAFRTSLQWQTALGCSAQSHIAPGGFGFSELSEYFHVKCCVWLNVTITLNHACAPQELLSELRQKE